MSVRRRLMWAVPVLLAASAVLAGCGLSGNDEPEAIAPEDVPAELLDPNPSSSTSTPAVGVPVSVYLLERDGEQERLAVVTRPVADPADPGQRVEAVLGPRMQDEIDAGLQTSIPVDTVLNDTQLDADTGVVTIDLSSELFNVEGEELSKAFAQIVYTVFEVDGVRQVRFLIDGQPGQALDDGGVGRDTVTLAHYRAYAPE